MKNTLNYLVALAIITILFASCAKDGATGPAGANGTNGGVGPAGPSLTGSIEGFVRKFDQYGNGIETGMSGVAVSLIGNTTVNTTTDSTGKYIFNNVSTGIYNLSATDSLFGYVMVNPAQFIGGGTLLRANITMTEIPNFMVTGMTFVDTVLNLTDSAIEINGTIGTTDGNAREAIIFIGSTINTNSNPANYQMFTNVAVKAGTNTFKLFIQLNSLYDLGYLPTQTIYFASYGISLPLTASSYQDATTGNNVFKAISPNAYPSSHMIQ